MILIPYTFNGTSLQSTDYQTSIPREQSALQLTANPSYIKRAGAVPVYAGKDFQPVVLVLEVEMQHDWMTTFESLNRLFDTKDETPRQFICTDSEDSNKQYYTYATAKQVQGGHDGPMAVVTLALDDPIWQSVTQYSQTWATTSSTDSTSVTAAGNDYSYPVFEITPTSAPSTDYLYNRFLRVLPTSSVPYPQRYLDITGATDTTFDTAALVTAGKMQADGDDLRVFRDGVEIDRWLNGMNTTDTHVIVVADMPPAYNMVLGEAIGSTDTIDEINLSITVANQAAMTALPNSGRLVIDTSLGSTDSEEFIYTGKTIVNMKLAFTVGARAVRGTTALAHAVGANVRYLPYDFNLIYGNASASAPVTDDTRKPLQSLTSRNNSFVYSGAFLDNGGTRPGGWVQRFHVVSDINNSLSGFYTSTDDAGDTDPASAMGIVLNTYQALGVWKADTVSIGWVGYFPDLVSSITASGAQNQSSANLSPSSPYPFALYGMTTIGGVYRVWADGIGAQASSDYDTWTTWSKASSDSTVSANTNELRWVMNGSILGSTDEHAKGEIDAITVGLTNPPHVKIGSEASNNKLDLTIGNSTTGDSFRVVYPLAINDTLIIDTDPSFPTAKHKGQVVNGSILLSSIRAAWLRLQPGANTLTLDNNLGANSDITIVVKWRDCMNFL